MACYFFDIRDGEAFAPDEVGMILPNIESAQEEAARSLGDLAREMVRGRPFRQVAIEVRDPNGPVLEVAWRSLRE